MKHHATLASHGDILGSVVQNNLVARKWNPYNRSMLRNNVAKCNTYLRDKEEIKAIGEATEVARKPMMVTYRSIN